MNVIKMLATKKYSIQFKSVAFFEGKEYKVPEEMPIFVADSVMENGYGEQVKGDKKPEQPTASSQADPEKEGSEEEEQVVDIEAMKKDELIAFAKANEFDLKGATKVADIKDAIIEAIEKESEESED